MLKLFVGLGMIAGSIIGGYLPMLWGASIFSVTSIITSAIGALLGIYLGNKIGQNY